MTSKNDDHRSFTAHVAFCDETKPFEWKCDASNPARAAEIATEEAWYSRGGLDNDEVGVKVVDDETGETLFFDVEIEAAVTATANRVRGDELRRRVAEHEAEEREVCT